MLRWCSHEGDSPDRILKEERIMMPRLLRKSRVIIMLLAGIFVLQGSLYAEQGRQGDHYAVVCVIDALHPDLFRQMVENGDLPNIKKYIYDRGLSVGNCISVFPTTSVSAMTTIMTGVYPGTHKMTGSQWFDRQTFTYRSYTGSNILLFESDFKKSTIKTVYDYFPRDDAISFGGIVGPLSGTDNGLLFDALNPVRQLVRFTYLAVTDILTKLQFRSGVPHFLALYEWGVNQKSRRKGGFGEGVRAAMKKTDADLGRIINDYKQRGILDRTYLIVLSDYGVAPVDERFSIDTLLGKRGFKKRLVSYNIAEPYIPFSVNKKESYSFAPFRMERIDSLFGVPLYLNRYTAIVGNNAGGQASLYFAKRGGYDKANTWSSENWKKDVVYTDLLRYYLGPERKYHYCDVISYLKDIDGIDFFIVKETLYEPGKEFKVRVVSKCGESLITRSGTGHQSYRYKYQRLSGIDPLRYKNHEKTKNLMDGKFHFGQEWLEASYDQDYPDACVQLVQLMESDRSGSVVISCAEDWGVNSYIVSRHGGYLPDEIRATFCISGPGIEKGEIEYARLADFTPSVLYLLNRPFNPDDFDGSVIPALREAVKNRGK